MKKSPKIGFVSLGCPKNLVDSERIITELQIKGYEIVDTYEDANLVIVNTCGFINSAIQDSLEAIEEALEENGKVIVTGCLGSQKEMLENKFPKLVGITSAHDYEGVLSLVLETLAQPEHNPFEDLVPDTGIKLTPKHYAYLKIAEGCDHSCTFCIIPSLRGKLTSRDIDKVLLEANKLVTSGTQELLVISQDTSAYGADLNFKTGFYNGMPMTNNLLSLCDALGDLPAWIRLHYLYPTPALQSIIPLMAQKKIVPYLDMPLQHASTNVLKQMKRPGSYTKMTDRIAKMRDLCPDLALRSTFIVGFPGEMQEDFDTLLNFIEDVQFEHLGAFTYSHVEGAKANLLDNPVAADIAQARYNLLMETQQKITDKLLRDKYLNTEQEVLIDSIGEEGILGRTMYQAPEVDGQVYVNLFDTQNIPQAGTRVKVKIEHADNYDLYGQKIGK